MGTDLARVRYIDHNERVRNLVNTWLDGQESPHTTKAYRTDLDLWLNWCADPSGDLPPFDPLAARHAFVKNWIRSRADDGDSEATRARRLSSVSSWYRWLIREGQITYNPADLGSKERPTVDRHFSPTMALSAENAARLLAAADADPNPRSAAVVSLLLYDGLRIAELASADVEDIDYGSGHPLLTVLGKGRRKRTIPIPPPAHQRWQQYHAARLSRADLLPTLQAGTGTTRPLISTGTGARIGQPEAWRLIRRLGDQAGFDELTVRRLSPHVLRHTCATLLLDAGVALRDVQRFLGHADSATTGRYDHGEQTPERSPAYKMMAVLGL